MLFKLNVEFSKNDCQKLYDTDSKIVIAKPDQSGKPNVVWIVFDPWPNSSIQWREEYGIYASNKKIQQGAVITQMSSTDIPVTPSNSYILKPSGIFSEEMCEGGNPHAFTVTNEYNNLNEKSGKGYLTIGLTQNANANGDDFTGVVSAFCVPFMHTLVMEPSTTVYIWTQGNITSGSVINDTQHEMTEVKFDHGITSINLRYDAESGKFIPKDEK